MRWARGAAAVILLTTWSGCGASVETQSTETTAVEAQEGETIEEPAEPAAERVSEERPVPPTVSDEAQRRAMDFLELWLEDRTQSRIILRGVNDHIIRTQGDSEGPPRFPPSARRLPELPCCRGTDGRCPVDDTLWEEPSWREIGFSIDEPHRLQYEYRSEESSYTLRSEGDLGCSGRPVRFEIAGTSTEMGIMVERDIEVAPDSEGRGLVDLTADLAAIYAGRLCAAAEGGVAIRDLGEELESLRLFFSHQVRPNHRELLGQSRPPEGAREQRILDASLAAAYCLAVMETRRY